jgi:Mlc titration factor MtfA (ptsG expression regulator)
VREHVFDQPQGLQQAEPELYEVFSKFYRQDPAALEERFNSTRER